MMSSDFAQLDDLNSDGVARFKEQARLRAQGAQPLTRAPADLSEVIVAEGDSWFDYLPGTDVIDCLRNLFGYRVENFAQAGDTLENMVYGSRIDRDFQAVSPTIDKVLRRVAELKPKVFLFSGGGNDVAGDAFESYLHHAGSGLPTLRMQYVQATIKTVFRQYMEDLVAKIAAVSPRTRVFVHGYGHTLPTGRGVEFLFISFVGPWLRPALARKRIYNDAQGVGAVRTLIDTFNEMLAELQAAHPNRVTYVDLRQLLDPAADWANELHPKNSAFARIAARIHEQITSL